MTSKLTEAQAVLALSKLEARLWKALALNQWPNAADLDLAESLSNWWTGRATLEGAGR